MGAEISLTDALKIYAILHNTNRIVSTEDREAEKLAELAAEEEEREPSVVEDEPRSEFEIFYDTKTAREIRERIATEPAFAKFARTQIATEVQQSGDGIKPTATAEVHSALKKFAQQYIQTPSGQLRPVMGYVTTQDGTRFTLQKFNELVAEASAANLIF